MKLCFISIAAIFQVDMSKINLDTIKPWICKRLTELLGFEDDVVIEFIFNQLDEKASKILLVHIYFQQASCTS